MSAPPFPTTATPSDLVGRVLGLNPGMMTGPGTNTYLVGRRDPILIDTGAGVPDYVPLLERYLGGDEISFEELEHTLAKGVDHFASLGIEYPIAQAGLALVCLVGLISPRERVQIAVLLLVIAYQTSRIVRFFDVVQ